MCDWIYEIIANSKENMDENNLNINCVKEAFNASNNNYNYMNMNGA